MMTVPVMVRSPEMVVNDMGDYVPGDAHTTVETRGVLIRRQMDPRSVPTDHREAAKLLLMTDRVRPSAHSTVTVGGEEWQVEALVPRVAPPFASMSTAHVEVLLYREGGDY